MNENLLRLIYSHKKCNLTDRQIISVLVGMGVIESVALEHLDYYNKMEKKQKGDVMDNPELAPDRSREVPPEEEKKTKNIKENYMKKFTALQLYENILQANENLKEFSKTNEKSSYSAMMASSVLEQAINAFPSKINLIASRKANGLPCDESSISPAIKYEIAESVYNSLRNEWLPDAKNLCNYIAGTMNDDKWGYVAAQALKRCNGKTANNMYRGLEEQLTRVLESDDIFENLKNLAFGQEYWSVECKQIVALIESEQYSKTGEYNKSVVDNGGCTMLEMFSPVINGENGTTFNLWGKNYTIKSGKVSEASVTDERYNDVVNGLSKLAYCDADKCLEYYGANGKVLQYSVDEDRIFIGDNDLTGKSSLELRESLMSAGLFNRRTVQDADILTKFFESRDMLARLNNCVNLKNDALAGLFLTVISVEEGVYVNKVDFGRGINEMKYFESATEARGFIKESINYDATFILKEKLVKEEDKRAEIAEKRRQIEERIAFLKEKRNKVSEAISGLPVNIDNSSLMEALNLIECELRKNEDELAATFASNLDPDYVPVKVCNVCGTLNIGDVVYVRATEFTSQPECTTITVIDPATNQQVVVNKTDLVYDINHNEQPAPVNEPAAPEEPAQPGEGQPVEPAQPAEPATPEEPCQPKICPTCGAQMINDVCEACCGKGENGDKPAVEEE